jgi:hypothetical protein
MSQSETSKRHEENRVGLDELGFGPDSILMSDPKLFLDSAFLAIVTAEFRQELGDDCCRQALIEIGRHHGLRDANRTVCSESRADLDRALAVAPSGPNLSMKFSSAHRSSGVLVLRGSWPEAHESLARLSRLGASEVPSCYLSAGYSAGWLAEIYNAEVEINEIACRSNGDRQCQFEAHLICLENGLEPSTSKPITLASTVAPCANETSTEERLIDLPMGDTDSHSANNPAQRLRAEPHKPSHPKAVDAETSLYSHIDPEDNAVHAWGPVMVLPFIDPDIADTTIQALEGESFTQHIKAVVIDLRGRPIDSERSAESLERILKKIDRWHAQAILAGVSEANQASVRAFSSVCLVSHKKLSEAIAMGFQIAEAQRHAL